MRHALLTTVALALAAPAAAAPVDLARLQAGEKVHGFRVASVYLDARDRPLGARFSHLATGFTLDLLRIESVPQAFTWVNTFATSDQGEPHTQEHLLLLRQPQPQARHRRALGLRLGAGMGREPDPHFLQRRGAAAHVRRGHIGPDKQLQAWERYLKATEGESTRLYRLFGRDFWMP